MLGSRGKTLTPEIYAAEPLGFMAQQPMATAVAPLVEIPTAPRVQPKFFDKAGLGSKLLNGLDAFVTTLGAARGNPMQLQMLQQRAGMQRQAQEDERADQRYRQQMEMQQAQANRPQVVNTGGGGYTIVNPSDGSVIGERQPVPQQGETERLIAAYGVLPDGDPRKPLIERAIRGYQYTAPVMQARTDGQIAVADRRAANSAALKAQPTYANTHPKGGGGGGITATARARYMAEAEAAIARGAPREAVMARLAKMGVQ